MVRWVANLSDLRPGEREQYLKERAEYDALLKREAEEEAQQAALRRTQALRLRDNLHQAFQAYSEYLEQNPTSDESTSQWQASGERAMEVLRLRREGANRAPRCGHIKANGVPCGSPRLKDGMRCFAHQQMADARPEKLDLQAVEDPDGIQMALMQVQRALIDDQISERKAGLLLYSLQIAAGNVSKTTFDDWDDEDLVLERPTVVERPQVVERTKNENALTSEDAEDHVGINVEVGRNMRLLIYSGRRQQTTAELGSPAVLTAQPKAAAVQNARNGGQRDVRHSLP